MGDILEIGRGCPDLFAGNNENKILTECKKCNECKLETFNYLSDIPEKYQHCEFVEVRFKNTRKSFFKVPEGLTLEVGDVVAVEANPGHDIGIVSLTGYLVKRQMIKQRFFEKNQPIRSVYRKARPTDIEKWKLAISREKGLMLEARKIAAEMGLEMKIGDVEVQGDNTKAIFYYIADGRVDFRELIKVYAQKFRLRIEMRQIGARQEAGRIGGIGSCGRETCCSTYLTNFVSVTTNVAREQGVSLNPQKLTGHCGKLKCCLNYEIDAYIDAKKDFPDTSIPLETEAGTLYHLKTDVFKRLMWYSYNKETPEDVVCLTVEKVKEIIEANKRGEKVAKIKSIESRDWKSMIEYVTKEEEESLTNYEDSDNEYINNE